MRNASALLVLFLVVAAGVTSPTQAAWTWETLDYPGASDTYPMGISGNVIVGYYSGSSGSHGFVYDGESWLTLDYPGPGRTSLRGISGSKIVGKYQDSTYPYQSHAVLYDGASWQMLNYPGAAATYAHGVFGDRIFGSYEDDVGKKHGFIYDGSSWLTVDYPGAATSGVTGIDDDRLAGWYTDSQGGTHGFFFDGETWHNLDVHLALPSPPYAGTAASAISGNLVVGTYATLGWGWNSDTKGFLYDSDTSTWVASYLNYPGARDTYVHGISGHRIVGYYSLSVPGYEYLRGPAHGFILTVPEPMSLVLLAAGGILALRRRLA